MSTSSMQIAVIKGDGIGVDVTEATIAVVKAAREKVSGFRPSATKMVLKFHLICA